MDTVTGKSKVDEIRTSSGTFISRAQPCAPRLLLHRALLTRRCADAEDPVMMRIGKRAAELTMLPLEHQEARE